MENLAKRLTSLRESKGWTKTYVANKLGIKTLSTYANYEYGLREPDMDTLIRISNLYNITVDDLIGAPVEGKEIRKVGGKEIDISELTENQKVVLDWALEQESLSMFDNTDDLRKILDDIAVIIKYENQKNSKK